MKHKRIILVLFLCIAAFSFFSYGNLAHAYDRPLFVEISTDWCYACKILKPTIEQLENQYGNQVTFLRLNATNEDTLNEARLLAREYGVLDFFEANRNAFPRVAIFCGSTLLPEKNILGAAKIETYKEALDILASSSCPLSNNFTTADLGPGRPDDPEYKEIAEGRPDQPFCLGRPDEVPPSGRPSELTFWLVGQHIPLQAYYQYLVLPKCNGSSVVCGSSSIQANSGIKGNSANTNNNENAPIYKPWTPNATRNEKGFDTVNRKG